MLCEVGDSISSQSTASLGLAGATAPWLLAGGCRNLSSPGRNRHVPNEPLPSSSNEAEEVDNSILDQDVLPCLFKHKKYTSGSMPC